MAGEFKCSPEELEIQSGKYAEAAENVNEVLSQLQRITDNLLSVWEGNGARSYEDAFLKGIKPNFESARDLLSDVSQRLTASAKSYRAADEQSTNSYKTN